MPWASDFLREATKEVRRSTTHQHAVADDSEGQVGDGNNAQSRPELQVNIANGALSAIRGTSSRWELSVLASCRACNCDRRRHSRSSALDPRIPE